MKKNTHPPYQDILFVDSSTGYKFVCGSTLKPEKTEKFEGKEYPVFYVSVSSASHPFFTGSKQFIDSEGRVDKFLKRYANATAKLKEEPKKDQKKDSKKEPKKAEAKKAEPKKAEAKKEGSKKEEPKIEEPKARKKKSAKE